MVLRKGCHRFVLVAMEQNFTEGNAEMVILHISEYAAPASALQSTRYESEAVEMRNVWCWAAQQCQEL